MDREPVSQSQHNGQLPDRELYWQGLNRKLRLAFIAGAEAHSRRVAGRPLSAEELRRVLRRYPGDATEQGLGTDGEG